MDLARFLCVAVVATAPFFAHAQDAGLALPDAGPADAGEADGGAPSGVLTPPELTRFVQADYPPELFAQGATGSVTLDLVVGAGGEVERATVAAATNAAFAHAAVHAAAQLEFKPATLDGKPVPVALQYRYDFVIQKQAPPPPRELPVALFGRVVERGTRAPVAGAAVQAGAAVATTGPDGRFELRGLPPGPVEVRVASADHKPFAVGETVEAGKKKEVEYRLTRRHYSPFEATVRGERERKEVAVHTLHLEEVATLPGTQGDVLKVLQDFPGVARSPYGIGLLVVRGSAPSDTKVYLDGVEIPLLFHFGGITSVVNSEILSSLDFYPGNFGVRFGRAMGGAVDVKTREPKRQFHGDVQLDVFDGTALVEGPVGDGSILATARRSWVDQVLGVVLPIVAPDVSSDLRVAPRYYDYQLKFSYPLAGGAFSAMLYGDDDVLAFVRPTDTLDRPTFFLETGFQRLAAHWDRLFAGGVRNRATLAGGFDHIEAIQSDNFGITTDLSDLALRDTVDIPVSSALSLSAGTDTTWRGYTYDVFAPPGAAPGKVGGSSFGGDTTVGANASGTWFAPSIFAEAEWKPHPRWRLVPGLRADSDSRLTHAKVWLDPRLSVFYRAGDSTELTAAAGRYGQPPDPQSFAQTFGNPYVGPQHAWQYALGVNQDLPWDVRAELTGFYKDMRDLVVATRATDAAGNLKRLSNAGLGEAVGFETLIRRQLAKGLYGWLAYTLSRSIRRDDPTLPTFPKFHLFSFDQTHILTFILSYRTGNDWIFGSRLRWVSGNPYTPCVNHLYDADSGGYVCIAHNPPFNDRRPAFFQLDARVDKRFVFDKWMLALYLDVQNVTNHVNEEFQFFNYDYTAEVPIPGLPFFPALGIRAEW